MRFFLTLFLALTLAISLAPSFVYAEDEPPSPVAPTFQVPIPGFDFTGSVLITGDAAVDDCAPRHVCVSTLGRYINAVFKYGLGAGIIITIVLIMVGGVEWMIGSTVGGISRGKARIQKASIGLLLLLTVTVFLSFINPIITSLNTLSIDTVRKIPSVAIEMVTAPSAINTDIQNAQGELIHAVSVEKVIDPETGSMIDHPNIDTRLGSGASLVHESMLDRIQYAADNLKTRTNGENHLLVIAAFQEPNKTMRRFYDNCLKDEGTCTEIVCNPLPASLGYIEGDYETGFRLTSQARQVMAEQKLDENQFVDLMASLAAGNSQRSCPYETGYSIGVICNDENERKIDDLSCQVELEWAMKNMGFCRSYFQPWYYEFNGHQTSVKQCDWLVGTMLRPNSICHNPTGEEVEYTDTSESSACAVNYENQIDTCLRFDLKTGTCLWTRQQELNDAANVIH